jgi:hypothetical protein
MRRTPNNGAPSLVGDSVRNAFRSIARIACNCNQAFLLQAVYLHHLIDDFDNGFGLAIVCLYRFEKFLHRFCRSTWNENNRNVDDCIRARGGFIEEEVV